MTQNVDNFDITISRLLILSYLDIILKLRQLVFSKFEEVNFEYILEHIIYLLNCYIVSCMYIAMCKRTTNQFNQKILPPQDNYF